MSRQTWKCALVTGASSGIGDAFARQLAAEGTDLVVTARDEGRLDFLADALRAEHGVEVEVLVADLAADDGRRRVETRLADGERPIDLLVNNAGFGDAGRFQDADIDRQESEVDVNVVAVMRLTHAALGPMLRRGAGAILNVSSLVSRTPSPSNPTYAATKAFVTSFSEGLYEDLLDDPVTVTALEPGYTLTEFQERAGVVHSAGAPDLFWMTAEQVAAEGLDGVRKGKAIVVPGIGYRIAAGLSGFVPKVATRRLIGFAARHLGPDEAEERSADDS